MDKLPVEIAFDIFRKSLPAPNYKFPTSTLEHAPLSISHVCRAWRSIALSCGDLWSYQHIDLNKYNSECNKRKLTILKDVFDTWLSRSGRSPLNISFSCPIAVVCRDRNFQSVARHMIDSLVDQQHRWKYMDLSIPWYFPGNPSHLPDNIVLNNMPLLTSLHVGADNDTIRIVVDISRSLLLEEAIVCGADILPVHKPIETLRLPCSLTFFGENSDYLRSCLSFLRAAPNLKHFQVSICTEESLNSVHPHLFDQLQTLAVGYDRAASLFMDSITLPSLQALSYSGSRKVTDDSALFRFIQRSIPPLTFLEVKEVDGESLLPVLHLVPALMDLRVVRGHFTQRFFQELAVPDITDRDKQHVKNALTCPALASICLSRLDIAADMNACIMALIDMVKSRHEVLGSFDKIRLRSSPEDTNIDVPVGEISRHIKNLEVFLKRFKVVLGRRFEPRYPFLRGESDYDFI